MLVHAKCCSDFRQFSRRRGGGRENDGSECVGQSERTSEALLVPTGVRELVTQNLEVAIERCRSSKAGASWHALSKCGGVGNYCNLKRSVVVIDAAKK